MPNQTLSFNLLKDFLKSEELILRIPFYKYRDILDWLELGYIELGEFNSLKHSMNIEFSLKSNLIEYSFKIGAGKIVDREIFNSNEEALREFNKLKNRLIKLEKLKILKNSNSKYNTK